MRLGLLDVPGLLEETLELAPVADALGYHRYWIAEHQPQPTPMLAVALVAGLTERIRVGTAGILFHFYAPRRAAYDFQFLERAFSGRIDAGFCGGGVAPRLAPDLEGRDMDTVVAAYPARVAELLRQLRNISGERGFDPQSAWIGAPETIPEIWSLGGGPRSADLAARHGLCFGYDLLYHHSKDDPATTERYRAGFVALPSQPHPVVAVAVGGMCAETTAEARGQADAYQNGFFKPRVVGDPATCAAMLRGLRDRFGADDVVFAELSPGLAARRRGMELLAAELGLGAQDRQLTTP